MGARMCAFHDMNEAASAKPGFIGRPVKWGLYSWSGLSWPLCALRRTPPLATHRYRASPAPSLAQSRWLLLLLIACAAPQPER